MLLTKEVEVKVNGRTIKYYTSKGYNLPQKISSRDRKSMVTDYSIPIIVKIEDLPKHSKSLIDCQCDYCGRIKSIPYCQYTDSIKGNNSYACADCRIKKAFDITQSKYGVNGYTSTKEFRIKATKTFLEKYGCENISQSPIIKEKKAQTFYQNSSQKASKQQRYINRLYEGILNYPIMAYCADIYLANNNLIVEYDGSGHMLNVFTGHESIEDYNQKELIRYNVLKREGYKQMRIISSTDKLPSDEILLQMLEHTRRYFSDYPDRSWIEFNIDTSTVRNAEQKDGVFFNYGELRRIKKSDLPDIIGNNENDESCA